MCKEIPLLKANQVDVRLQRNSDTWAVLLLYKDARTDMNILDSTFGCMNWKREHKMCGDRFTCVVSIYDENKQEWISKEDVGTESKAEAEKGQASDSFKRACTNWGIGRELYASPDIMVNIASDELNNKGQVRQKFHVAEMEFDVERGEFKTLVIADSKNMVRFDYRNYKKQYLSQPYAYGGQPTQKPAQQPTQRPMAQPVAQQPTQRVAQQPVASQQASAENNYVRILSDGTIEAHFWIGKPYEKWQSVTQLTDKAKDWVLKHPKEYGVAAQWLQKNQ